MKKLSLLIGLVLSFLSFGLSAAYEVVTVADGGSLIGQVTFKGTPPPNKRILIAKDFGICGRGEREIPEVVVSIKGGLKETVVYIEKIPKGKAWASPEGGEYLLEQKGCRFIPYFQVVPKKQTLIIQNSDPVLHNINVRELIGRARRGLFNFGQPRQGQRVPQKIRPIRSPRIKVECEAHNFMHAWIFAAENPYYSVTNVDGSFKIDHVPAGTYTVKAWHPILGIQKSKVTVSSNGETEVYYEFSAKKR
ncbi:MAG: hypothetical protein ACE5JU_16290 [Candidatus Binatia bacterium]